MVYKISISSNRTNVNDALCWCIDNFQTRDYGVTCLFPDTTWDFNFRYEEQAMLFALKWA